MKLLQHPFGTAFLIALVIGNASAQEQSSGRPILGFTVDTTAASISRIVFWIGPPSDFGSLVPADSLFPDLSTFRHLKS